MAERFNRSLNLDRNFTYTPYEYDENSKHWVNFSKPASLKPIEVINADVTETQTVLDVNHGYCYIRNIGSADLYFLIDSSQDVTADNGVYLKSQSDFPLLQSIGQIKVISSGTTKIQIIKYQ